MEVCTVPILVIAGATDGLLAANVDDTLRCPDAVCVNHAVSVPLGGEPGLPIHRTAPRLLLHPFRMTVKLGYYAEGGSGEPVHR